MAIKAIGPNDKSRFIKMKTALRRHFLTSPLPSKIAVDMSARRLTRIEEVVVVVVVVVLNIHTGKPLVAVYHMRRSFHIGRRESSVPLEVSLERMSSPSPL